VVFKNLKRLLAGATLCISLSLLLWMVAGLPWNHKLQVSPLTLAILAGMALGNSVRPEFLERIHPGLRFCSKSSYDWGLCCTASGSR